MAPSKFSNCRSEMIRFTVKCRIFLLVIWFFLPSLAFFLGPGPVVSISGSARPPAIRCAQDAPPITNGSAVEGNLMMVLNSLVDNVNQSGYSISSRGENGDKIYGLAQCRGDLNASSCGACISEARYTLGVTCPNISGSIYSSLKGCFLRYAPHNFYSQLDLSYKFGQCDSTTVFSGTIPTPRFWDSQIDHLLTVVSGKAESSEVGYATASENGNYGLAQCWRDLNTSLCSQCLNALYSNFSFCPPGTSGGFVLNDHCIIDIVHGNKFYGDGVPLLSAPTGNGSAIPPLSSRSGSAIPPSSRSGKGPSIPQSSDSLTATKGKSNANLSLLLGLSIVGAFIMVLMLSFFVIWRKNYKKQLLPGFKPSTDASRAIFKSKLNYKSQTLKMATNNFSGTNKIGQGGFGSVYKGVLPNGREIAVKKLLVNKEQNLFEFFNEVNLISCVQHKNLVKLLGCSVDSTDKLLVYEYLPNKSLDYFIFNKNMGNMLDWQRRFDIILGIASGLSYLHQESDIRIIHRDIKASNILLDQHFKPKIADFGLVRHFAEDQTHLSTGIVGTRGYMAPEYIMEGHLTEKVDIYAFGVLVLEIISGRKNNTTMQPNDTPSLLTMVWNHYLSSTLSNIIDANIQQYYKDKVLQVVDIALLCTQGSATLRPSMSKVIGFLTNKEPEIPRATCPPFIGVIHSQSNTDSSVALSNLQSTINTSVSNASMESIALFPATISLNTISTSSYGPR